MLSTEVEAKQLWCPMVRIARRETVDRSASSAPDVVGGCNSDALGGNRIPASCRCVASQCAMWRWDNFDLSLNDVLAGVRPARGYCGLAGRPQVMLP